MRFESRERCQAAQSPERARDGTKVEMSRPATLRAIAQGRKRLLGLLFCTPRLNLVRLGANGLHRHRTRHIRRHIRRHDVLLQVNIGNLAAISRYQLPLLEYNKPRYYGCAIGLTESGVPSLHVSPPLQEWQLSRYPNHCMTAAIKLDSRALLGTPSLAHFCPAACDPILSSHLSDPQPELYSLRLPRS